MPSKADVKAWKAQLVAQAEQQILKLTDSGQFKKYLNTLAKFHHYSARNIDLIYAQNPQATQVAGFKQWQTDFNRTVNKGAKSIRIAAPIIKKLTPAEQKRLDTTDERAKDKAVIHSALSEIQQVSNKVIELSDGLTKQLGLQEAPKEPAHDLNKSYQGLQQQVQQARNPQQKSELKNKLNDIHHEISKRTQKQLQAFAEENPSIKQPKSELDQSQKH